MTKPLNGSHKFVLTPGQPPRIRRRPAAPPPAYRTPQGSFSPRNLAEPRLALIAQCVAEEYGLAPAEIAAPGRAQRIARPRQVVHYLASMLTSRSGNTIGFYVGQCDHTTVHHGERRVRRRIETDTAFAETVARLKDRVMELHRAEVAARPSAPVGVVQAAPAPSAAAGVQPEHTT